MQKTCNNVATNYVLHGNNVVHLTHGSNTLHFFYDAQNSPAVVEYNGVSYGYVKNLQGDIIAIVNASGTKVVEYVYDAWGKLLSKTGSMASTLGTLNPFRYRGYVYDEETGLYYLRSRYYNPVWGRFINLDSNIVGNLFSYCNNNPVILEDSNGQFACYASCMLLADGGGGGILSPSQKTPQAVLTKGMRGTNSGKIPVGYLLAYLDQMVQSGDWKYVENKMEWKNVDCIGMIRIAYQQYSQKLAKNSQTYVGGMYSQAVANGIEILPVISNEGDIAPGMAIYWYDPTHKNKKGEIRPWYHIGVYVGNYYDASTQTYYYDAVIEAATGSYNRVIARSLQDINSGLSKTTTLYYGYLQDVEY